MSTCDYCSESIPSIQGFHYIEDPEGMEGTAKIPCPLYGLDPRIELAFDMLGGMWSWSEENGYFLTGETWPLRAGRLLRDVVGRPARNPFEKIDVP